MSIVWKIGPLLSAVFSRGSRCKTSYGHLIGWRLGGGHINPPVSSAVRHILFECRYSRRIWTDAATWMGCQNLLTCLGSGRPTVCDYWKALATSQSASPKGLKTAIILIAWEIWKERNARVFNNKFTMPSVLMQRIKDGGKNWIMAGAKKLAELLG